MEVFCVGLLGWERVGTNYSDGADFRFIMGWGAQQKVAFVLLIYLLGFIM
jgi:hypothetical protein